MKSPLKRNEPTQRGKTLRDLGKKWLDRVEASGKTEKVWLDDAKKAVQAFTNEGGGEAYGGEVINAQGYDFNILFSNVETIVPAVINSSPIPDIRRRFQDEDPAARIVADILERAIRVQIDDSRLQTELEAVAQDAFLAGRGPIRMRFYSDIVPTMPDAEELEDAAEDDARNDGDPEQSGGAEISESVDGEFPEDTAEIADRKITGDGLSMPAERLENERIRFEAVSWVDYRHGPAKRWDERPWEAFRFCVPSEDEGKSFDASLIGEQFSTGDLDDRRKTAGDELIGWEIWDKDSRRVIFIDDKGTVLKVVKDPLGLSGFFCSPDPIQPITINGRLMPVNPFAIYRRLADDLDQAVRRKNKLVDAMKVRGWYATSQTDLDTVLQLDDNEWAPIANPELWATNGGIEKAIAFWPLDRFIVAIQQLDTAIEQYKQWIYEITGISDIVRGATVASETATAQNIKSQWGSLRIQKMQRLMERTARDLFVMMAEIIPSKFSIPTIEEMTGIQMMPRQEDTPEKVQEKAAVLELWKKPLARYYRIDVESDSTVRADLTRQKQEIAEFLQGASAYFAAVAPLVQQGALPADAAVEIFASTARMFNLGKSVEDTLEQMVTRAKKMAQDAANAPPGQQPDPEKEAAAAKEQAMAAKLAMDTDARQQEMAARQQEADIRMQEAARKADADGVAAQHQAVLNQLEIELKELIVADKRAELALKRNQPSDQASVHKPPSESIAFKDLPPEGQAQMAAQAGIILSPQQMSDHQAALDAKEAAKAKASEEQRSATATV